MKFIKWSYFIIFFLFIGAGCIVESDKLIKEKLLIILKDDLEALVNDIPKENVADSVYYKIVSYKTFKTGKYTNKAVVDFFFINKIKVKVVRKYRYSAKYCKWERYFNEYKHFDIIRNK